MIDSSTAWIQTFTGRQFFPLDPRPGDVCIEDIAHALSMKCRFTGHCRQFYSVAQHSLNVCRVAKVLLSREMPSSAFSDRTILINALLHDAAEAYMPDIASPIKDWFHVSPREGAVIGRPVRVFESRILSVIFEALGVEMLPEGSLESVLVRQADLIMLSTEAKHLMAPPPAPWQKMPDPLDLDDVLFGPWAPAEAKAAFAVAMQHVIKEAKAA